VVQKGTDRPSISARISASAETNQGIGIELQGGVPDTVISSAAGSGGCRRPVDEAKGDVVHRTRWENTDIPITDSSRVVLYRRLRPAGQYLDAVRCEYERLKARVVMEPSRNGGEPSRWPQIIEIGFDPEITVSRSAFRNLVSASSDPCPPR